MCLCIMCISHANSYSLFLCVCHFQFYLVFLSAAIALHNCIRLVEIIFSFFVWASIRAPNSKTRLRPVDAKKEASRSARNSQRTHNLHNRTFSHFSTPYYSIMLHIFRFNCSYFGIFRWKRHVRVSTAHKHTHTVVVLQFEWRTENELTSKNSDL